MASETITITDNRTGKAYELPITDDTIRAIDLRQIKVKDDDFGMMTYDPAFMNTAACRSAITFIDGDRGILRYRGYPIEQIADKASFLEVAWLLNEGELPTKPQLDKWTNDIRYHTYVHTNIIKFLEGYRYDAHPMGMLLGVVGGLSTFYPDAKDIEDPANRYIQRVRLMAKLPTLAAFLFRHSRGLPYELPAQRPRLHRQLRQHDVQHRWQARTQPGAAEGARDPADPPRRSRAELLDQRGAGGRVVRRRSILGRFGRHRRALRPAARRRQ